LISHLIGYWARDDHHNHYRSSCLYFSGTTIIRFFLKISFGLDLRVLMVDDVVLINGSVIFGFCCWINGWFWKISDIYVTFHHFLPMVWAIWREKTKNFGGNISTQERISYFDHLNDDTTKVPREGGSVIVVPVYSAATTKKLAPVSMNFLPFEVLFRISIFPPPPCENRPGLEKHYTMSLRRVMIYLDTDLFPLLQHQYLRLHLRSWIKRTGKRPRILKKSSSLSLGLRDDGEYVVLVILSQRISVKSSCGWWPDLSTTYFIKSSLLLEFLFLMWFNIQRFISY
jgi:hypothetical protein